MRCQPLLDTAFEFYGEEARILDGIQNLLEEILRELDAYEEANKNGDDFFDKWVDCIHD